MITQAPDKQELKKLLGKKLYNSSEKLVEEINRRYTLEELWHSGGKKWVYELKFRKGSKTIYSLLFKKNILGFMVVFGKAEQARFETQRNEYSSLIVKGYDAATTYRDGKWLLFEAQEELFFDYIKLLLIKRKIEKEL